MHNKMFLISVYTENIVSLEKRIKNINSFKMVKPYYLPFIITFFKYIRIALSMDIYTKQHKHCIARCIKIFRSMYKSVWKMNGFKFTSKYLIVPMFICVCTLYRVHSKRNLFNMECKPHRQEFNAFHTRSIPIVRNLTQTYIRHN